MADIATAYVQIVPSARGMKSELSNIFGSEMPSAGKSAGNLLGSNLAGTLKRVLAAAGIGEALKKTLTEGAAMEQLKGGVEKIFNEIDTSKIMADAANAYRNLNMSANEYLATINDVGANFAATMGDEKGYSVAKTGLQAISDYASGTGKSVDVLSEKFTMITRSTSSYQSIADQFSGILPATSADFLKQAQAAGLLSGSYKKLTDVPVAEYQEAVAEMLKKGTAELGLAGNTAAETATTLSGSFAAMKASFSNVLGNLALGEDIGPSLNALAETVSSFLVGNLIPMVWNIITALPGALMTFINALLPANMSSIVWTAIAHFAAFMSQSFPTVLSQGVQLISNLVAGFSSGFPVFMSNLVSMLSAVLSTLFASFPSLLSAGSQLTSYLAQGFSSAVSSVVSAVTGIMGNVLSQFVKHLPDMLAQGIALILNLIAGLISMTGDVLATIATICKGIWDAFSEIDWGEVGWAIMEGIYQGINNGIDRIIQAAKDAANKAFAAAKEALGIKSPSRVFRAEVGYRISEGAALGITDGIPLMTRAMAALTSATHTAFTSRLKMNADFSGSGTGGFGRQVIIHQYIYSEAKTAADLMREARYEAEKAVLFGV